MSKNERTFRIAIVGGGISGIAQAIRLKEALENRAEVTIYERENRIGGVWRDSLWPNAGVDVPIHLYSLYSDLNPEWTTVYASQPEVLAYWESLVQKHGIQDSIRYNSRFTSSAWSEENQSHQITFARKSGEEYHVTANVLISAVGPLAKPIIPELPGLEKFKGSYFHNLRWDPNVSLEGKKISLVGNGSSGIQLAPGVAAIKGVQLTHFIRSGGYFLPKVNSSFSSLQKAVFRWVPGAQRAYRAYVHFHLSWRLGPQTDSAHPKHLKLQTELLDYLRRTAPAEYHDALTPDYPLGCKRVAWNAGWLESLHRPNVSLVAQHLVRVTEEGLVTADGKVHAADVIVFATGSDVPSYGVGLNHGVKGQNGLELSEYWKSIGGPQSYLGVAVPMFPNYFIVIGPNAASGSWGYTAGNQSAVIARLIKEMIHNSFSSLQPKIEPFEAHNEKVQARFATATFTSSECTNWYRLDGRVVLQSSFSPTGLWWQTRATRHFDWVGTRVKNGHLESVSFGSVVRWNRIIRWTVALVALGSAAVIFLLLHPLLRQGVERLAFKFGQH